MSFLSELTQQSQERRHRNYGILQLLQQPSAMGTSSTPGAPGADYSSLSNSPNGLTFGVQDPRYSGLANSVLQDVMGLGLPGVRSAGIFNARNIKGTNTPSEHAYGAAVDIHVPNLATGDKIYQYLQGLQSRYGFTNVLWRQKGHYDHLHVGFLY
jgi:hypothetical protein